MENSVESWLPTIVTVVAFIANAAYIKGVFGTKISYHDDSLKSIFVNKVDTHFCETVHAEIERRLNKVEDAGYAGEDRRKNTAPGKR